MLRPKGGRPRSGRLALTPPSTLATSTFPERAPFVRMDRAQAQAQAQAQAHVQAQAQAHAHAQAQAAQALF